MSRPLRVSLSLIVICVTLAASWAAAQSIGQDNRSTTTAGTSSTEVVSLNFSVVSGTYYTVHCDCHVTILNSSSSASVVSGYLCLYNNYGGSGAVCTTNQKHTIPANSYGQVVLGSEWEHLGWATNPVPYYCDVSSSQSPSSETNEISCHASPQ